MSKEPTIERQDSHIRTDQSNGPHLSGKLPGRFQNRIEESIDVDLINKTKLQIRNLVNEISELSKKETDAHRFFEGFLNRSTSALASIGGAIWLDESGSGSMELVYQIRFEDLNLESEEQDLKRHRLLLEALRRHGEPALVPPNSGADGEEESGNPTEHLLIFAPLVVNEVTIGLVEIIQRPGAGSTTQRGYLRFLTQISELASDFLKNRTIKNFEHERELWQKIDSFIGNIHVGLDPIQTSYIIANEGRRIIDCDRVSVLLNHGGRCTIAAVSGLDSIERRAEQIKYLQALTRTVIQSKKPLWYQGDDEHIPPQIEKRLHPYLDRSHAKLLTILPLQQQLQSDKQQTSSSDIFECIGALVIENLSDAHGDPAIRKRAELVQQHSETALTNALEHHGLFLLPLWKSLGRLSRPFSSSNLPKTIACLSMVSALLMFLAVFPYPFTLSANGILQPKIQSEVYAQVDGILQEVFVEENNSRQVQAGTLLAQMTNNDLMVQIQNLEGKINQTKEQIKNLQRAQRTQSQRSESKFDAIMLDGELNKSKEALNSLQRELALKRNEASRLSIASPANGYIMNWQIRKNLLKRPVRRGQNLMTIVNPDGGWELEIELPERRFGHLIRRVHSSKDPVDVTFALVSHPGTEFSGTLESIDRKLEVYSEDGNCIRAKVQFDNAQISNDLLKSGTRISAQLQCGTRSIGYVWFHELFETVQTTWNYWL
ncbi:MAG: HlyD family efflux transporter periplasmic adaptor subunit [Planctomycetota bacterium]